jgi:hypothetical protein
MPLSNAGMVLAANGIRAGITHLQLHSADPGAAGTNAATTAARKPVTWGAATNDGDFGLSASILFSGNGANTAVTWVSAWSALTAGTFLGRWPLTGDQSANAAGDYTLTALNIDGSSPT